MPATQLGKKAASEFNSLIVAKWDPTNVRGFDVSAALGNDAHLPLATTIDNVGAVYPSLVTTWSNETSGGETTYNFMTSRGPGQNRIGSLVVTARAEAEEDYVGDSANYSSEDGEDIVDVLLDEVERICIDNPLAPNTELNFVGSQPASSADDDQSEEPTTRIENIQIAYSWTRVPS